MASLFYSELQITLGDGRTTKRPLDSRLLGKRWVLRQFSHAAADAE